jgi:tetratricopeptide (TPR) repeat protein
MVCRILVPLACLAAFLAFPPAVEAQNPGALRDAASKAFEAGNYKVAIESAKEYLEKFPDDRDADKVRFLLGLAQYSDGDYKGCIATFADPKKLPEELIDTVNFHLGASHYFLGDFDKALAPLAAAAAAKDEEAQKTIAPFAQYYVGRSHMDKGSKLDEAKDKAGASRAFEAAVAAYTKFMTDHPGHELTTDVATARATANVLLGKLEDALKDLEALKAKPESAGMADDIDFLTGFVLTQSAQKLQADFKEEEAKAVIAQAKETYDRLARSSNLVMANQAAFQLANLDFASRQYQEAINAYRALRSKDELIKSQEERIAAVRRQISETGGNRDRIRALQQTLKREEQKLAGVQSAPELAVDGLSRVGDSFLQMGAQNPIYYDMARLTYRFASRFANEEQQKTLTIQTVISFAMQGLAAQAESKFTEFRQKYPNDPQAENVPFLIGQALQRQGKFEEAIQKFQESLEKFPNARVTPQVPKEIAACQVALGKADEAILTFDKFIQDAKAGKIKVAPEAIEDAQRQRSLALLAAQKVDEAIAAMRELAQTAKNAAIREEAAFQVGAMLSQANKHEDAGKAFQDFASKFPDSPRASQAAYFTAISYEKAKKFDEAIAAFRAAAARFKDTEIGIASLDKMWRTLLGQNKFDEAVAVQDEMVAAYPQAPQSMLALYDRAKHLDEKAKKKEEAAAAYQKVYEAYKKLPREVLDSPRGEAMSEYPSASLVRSAEIKRRDAVSLGVFKDLDEAKKADWKKNVAEARALLEKAVIEFPKSKALAFALSKLVESLLMEVEAGLMGLNDAATYLSRLAGGIREELAQVQIFIARASLMFQAGQAEQALLFYEEAFQKISDPKRMTWQDYDRFGSILLDNQRWDKARTVYTQLRENFTDQRAQAAATYGLGAAAQGKNDLVTAEKFFAELKEKYPWSEKIQEAEYGRAVALLAQGKYEEAFAILKAVLGTTRSSNETKAKSMLAFARGLIEMGDKGLKTEETKQGGNRPDLNIFELAHNNAIKIDIFYRSALPQLVAEALYVAAEAKFKQARTLTDAEAKAKAQADAKKLVDTLLKDHANSPWATKARDLK